jgi:hypothetical protein
MGVAIAQLVRLQLAALLVLALGACSFDASGLPGDDPVPGVTLPPTTTPPVVSPDGSVPGMPTPPTMPPPATVDAGPLLKGFMDTCRTDAECASNMCRSLRADERGPGNGFGGPPSPPGPNAENRCTKACVQDSDCPSADCGETHICLP